MVALFSLLILNLGLAEIPRPEELKIDCIEKGREPKATCDLSRGLCSDLIGSVSRGVESNFRTKIDYYYKGKDLSFSASKRENSPVGAPSGVPVCNPIEGETETNRRSENCGPLAGEVEESQRESSREQAFLRGSFIQSIKCYQAEVLGELRQKKLKISEACRSFAGEVQNKFSEASQLSAQIDPKEMAPICDGSRSVCDDPSQLGEAVQLGCKLENAKVHITRGLSYLVSCEIFARAERGYAETFLVDGAQDRFEKAAENEVIKPCSNAVGAEEWRKCYLNKLSGFMKGLSQRKFPSSGQCKPGPA